MSSVELAWASAEVENGGEATGPDADMTERFKAFADDSDAAG